MKTEITIVPCTGKHPLYHLYPQQLNPQDAYVRLDPEAGELSADWNAEAGNSIPMSVYHGLILRYPVNPYLATDEVNGLMGQLTPLALRVCNGYSEEWDGHNNVGRLTEDAEEASQDIQEICRDEQPSELEEGTEPWYDQ